MNTPSEKRGVYLTVEQIKDLSTLLHMLTGTIQTSGLVYEDRDTIDAVDVELKKWQDIAGEVSSSLAMSFMEPKRLKHFKLEPDKTPNEKKQGYTVMPEPGPVVIFEWVGEGTTPEEIALSAFDNIQQADSRPMCTVLMPDGAIHLVDLEHVDDPDGNYVPLETCKASGMHLKSCDDDGYCNNCGHQDNEEKGGEA